MRGAPFCKSKSFEQKEKGADLASLLAAPQQCGGPQKKRRPCATVAASQWLRRWQWRWCKGSAPVPQQCPKDVGLARRQ